MAKELYEKNRIRKEALEQIGGGPVLGGMKHITRPNLDQIEKGLDKIDPKRSQAVFVIGGLARKIRGTDKRLTSAGDCDLLNVTVPALHEKLEVDEHMQIKHTPVNHFTEKEMRKNFHVLSLRKFTMKYLPILEGVPLTNPNEGKELQQKVRENLVAVLGQKHFDDIWEGWTKAMKQRRGEPE